MAISAREKANITRWNGRQAPFYEVYYLTACDKAQSVGLWLRYTLLAPLDRPPEASVWAMLFDAKDPSRNEAIKKNYLLHDVRIERDVFYLSAGASAIFDDGCRGALDEAGRKVAWELKFPPHDRPEPLWSYPKAFYKTAFPKTKFVIPYLSTSFSGELTWNDRSWTFRDLPAHQGHLWGVEHGESWTWANANTFDDPSFAFNGLSARVRLGDKVSPPLTLLFFQWEGRLYRCNSVIQWWANRSVSDLDRWHFEAVSDDRMFVGDLHTTPDRMMAVRYQDPTGGSRYSHHTEHATLRIQIFEKTKTGWQALKTVTAEQSVAFEVVQREHDTRVRLLLP